MSRFWDRRRAAVAAEAEAEVLAVENEALRAQEAALAARSDDELLTELDLPAPEELVGGEQLRAFLRAELPQRLKTRALRSFWRSNPVLACLDGLNDYDDDYTAAATAGKAVNTLYQVGRGIVSPLAEVLEQITQTPEAEVEELEAVATHTVSVPDVVPPTSRQTTRIETPQATVAYVPNDVESEDDYTAAPTQRRMRFVFAADAESSSL